MNTAYKHLETKLRIAELTVGQWFGIILGVALAVGWGGYVSPFGTGLTLFTAIYLGGVPILLSLLATQAEFDLWLRVRSMISWRRDGGRYIPGPGMSAHGYVLTEEPRSERERPRDDVPELDFTTLWD
jgi:hypothetical protein